MNTLWPKGPKPSRCKPKARKMLSSKRPGSPTIGKPWAWSSAVGAATTTNQSAWATLCPLGSSAAAPPPWAGSAPPWPHTAWLRVAPRAQAWHCCTAAFNAPQPKVATRSRWAGKLVPSACAKGVAATDPLTRAAPGRGGCDGRAAGEGGGALSGGTTGGRAAINGMAAWVAADPSADWLNRGVAKAELGAAAPVAVALGAAVVSLRAGHTRMCISASMARWRSSRCKLTASTP